MAFKKRRKIGGKRKKHTEKVEPIVKHEAKAEAKTAGHEAEAKKPAGWFSSWFSKNTEDQKDDVVPVAGEMPATDNEQDAHIDF